MRLWTAECGKGLAPGTWSGQQRLHIAVDSMGGCDESPPVLYSRLTGFFALALFSAACGQESKGEASDAAPEADAFAAPDASQLPPTAPSTLVHYVTGDPADSRILPTGPALFLAGGGSDQDSGFAWAQEIAPQGDLVVLRTSGSDGYNDYLYSDIGGFDSVETMLVDTRALAEDAYVAWTLQHAEVIFMAGGDQWTYLDTWRGTEVQSALAEAWQRGAVIGGTSAGCAVLGEFAFSADNDTVYSSEALSDPYNEFMTLERNFVEFPLMAGVITDTHFAARDRMGRLAGFMARIISDDLHASPIGLGIDEATAILISTDGSARVIGNGSVYLVTATAPPSQCESTLPLSFESLSYRVLGDGDTLSFPGGTSASAPLPLSIEEGVMTPMSPYQ